MASITDRSERCIDVVYATQSNTSLIAASDLSREVRRRHIYCRIRACNDATELQPEFLVQPFPATADNDPSSCQPSPVDSAPQTGAAARNCSYYVFLVSTTGQGVVPNNMLRYWQKLLRKDLPNNMYSNVRFTVFGLGDSRYPLYNVAARRLRQRLIQLGAEEFYRLGLGDAQHDFGYEGEFDPWLSGLLEAVDSLMPIPPGKRIVAETQMPRAKFNVKLEMPSEDRLTIPPRPKGGGIGGSTEGYATVLVNERATPPSHFQDVRYIQLALKTSCQTKIEYSPGDAIMIYPAVNSEVVSRFLRIMNLDPKRHVTISAMSEEEPSPFPSTPVSVLAIFTYYLNLTAIPDRWFFRYLSFFADEAEEKERLLELGGRSPESKDFYYEYCVLERRSYFDVMWDFASCAPPLHHLISMVPPVIPRKFSLACDSDWYKSDASRFLTEARMLSRGYPTFALHSSPVAYQLFHQSDVFRRLAVGGLTATASPADIRNSSNDENPTEQTNECIVDLCVAIVEFKTKMQREIRGFASDFLFQLKAGEKIPFAPEDIGSAVDFPDPSDPSIPFILIAPGTGVAPVRSVIQRRHLQYTKAASLHGEVFRQELMARPRDLVFLGFRHRKVDFLYDAEWEFYQSVAYVNDMGQHRALKWLDVHVAFSRDDPERKVYVQDLIEGHAEQVFNLLQSGAYIVICGRSHPMPGQVEDSIKEVIQTVGKFDEETASLYVRRLKRQSRWICDTWG